MVFCRHERRSANDNKSDKLEVANQRYKDFTTFTANQANFIKDENKAHKHIFDELKDVIPLSCFAEMVEGKRKSAGK